MLITSAYILDSLENILYSRSSATRLCLSSASSSAVAGCSSNAVNGMWPYPFGMNLNSIGGGGSGWHKSSLQLGGGGGTFSTPLAGNMCVAASRDGKREPAEVEIASAGTVPVPVAAIIEGSAWRRSHSIVSPSVRRPSSRVSWNRRAAQSGGIRTRRPRPLTLVWRSLVELWRRAFLVETPASGLGVRAWSSCRGGSERDAETRWGSISEEEGMLGFDWLGFFLVFLMKSLMTPHQWLYIYWP